MSLNISSDAILENNKLNSDNVQLLLLRIVYGSEDHIKICLNNDTITWDGETWTPAIFSLSGLSESKDAEIPGVNLQFVDINRNIIPLIEEYDGGVGATVTMYIVNSKYLANTTPELEHEFEIIDVSILENHTINFKLGTENLLHKRIPTNRYLKNRCRWVFKDIVTCQYSGVETECNKTYSRCEELNNDARFGGFPGIGVSGFYR